MNNDHEGAKHLRDKIGTCILNNIDRKDCGIEGAITAILAIPEIQALTSLPAKRGDEGVNHPLYLAGYKTGFRDAHSSLPKPLNEDDAVDRLLTGYYEGKSHAVAFKHPQAAERHRLKYAYRALQQALSTPTEQPIGTRAISNAYLEGFLDRSNERYEQGHFTKVWENSLSKQECDRLAKPPKLDGE